MKKMSENSSIGILCRTMDERRKAVFPILHIWRMQKRKHRMEENGTKVPRTERRKTPSGCTEHGTKFIQAK